MKKKPLAGLVIGVLVLIMGGIAQAEVVLYTDKAAFIGATSAPLTSIGFDVDFDGNPIIAESPGVLADTLFSGYGITFGAGVVFGDSNLPFTGVTPPNIITNSGINAPTPALELRVTNQWSWNHKRRC